MQLVHVNDLQRNSKQSQTNSDHWVLGLSSDVGLINFLSSGLWGNKHDLKHLGEFINNSALGVDQGLNEEQSRNKSNMNPNEPCEEMTVPVIYEFNMKKKLAKDLIVQTNSCSHIHSHTHTYHP